MIHYMLIWTKKALYNKQPSDKLFYPRQNVTENFNNTLQEFSHPL